ncbi:MAG TPA: hypothetical protein VK348_10710, partial [Planctomycetota bacterium]|nr:hypothetical protein [Planctomycetota bacterium]
MTPSFTGFQRQRTSTRRVRVGDRVARWVVTAGGLLTIAAVLLVCLFLLWVALPLLAGAAIQPAGTAPSTAGKAHLLHQQVDRYRQVAWQLFDDGHVRAFAIRSGELLADASAYDPAQVADAVVHGDTEHGDTLLLARHDGRVATVRIAVTADPVAIEQAPAKARALAEGASLRIDDAVWQRTPGQLRRQGLQVRSGEVLELGTVPVARADFVDGGAGCVIAAVTTDRRLHLHAVSSRHNLITDEDETVMTGGAVPLADIGVVHSELPDRVLLAGAGDNVYLLWNDGRLVRVDARRLEAPVHAETLDILPEHGVRMTACASLLGNGTLLVGDGRGRVRALFRTKPARPAGRDGAQLTLAHEFTAGTAAAVTSIAVSAQSRLLLVGYADGWLRLFHGTSERLMAEVHTPDAAPVLLATLAPMDDGILAVTDQGIASFDLRPGHPEVTLASIALPVWYEGASGPEHVWQATGGNDFEPKFGLWPLVFGTLKATLYCLLFGVPLALLAAIYTSEFLHPRRRAKVKPLLEMMASLPSVVLGFLAAMVFAPLVERHLLTILAAFAAVPLCWLLGAQATQALPQRWRLFAERWRLPLALVTLLLSLLFAEALGRVTQALL